MKTRQPLFLVALLAVLCGGASAEAQPVQGYVDLHSHLMAEHSFGGGWFAGAVEGPMDQAVQRCDGNFPGRSHAATRFPVVSEFLGADTGWHLGRRRGYDRRECRYVFGIPVPGTCPQEHFENWPMWDAIAHQQMWQGWLQHAHQGGLRIMVVSLAESNFLCNNTASETRRYDCDEMASVKRQITQLQGFVSRNSGWVGIATTPAQARTLVQQGKLALVLAVEVTQLFPSGDYLTQLDELRGMGVRSVQVVHHADNRFGGAAPIPKLMSAANKVEFLSGGDLTRINDIVCRDGWGSSGKCNGDTFLNERGLSAEGTNLVRAMMDRGMLVDVAHLSRKAFTNVYQVAQQRANYPLLYSHAHMWNTISSSEERHEKYIRPEEIQMITNTGGMVGLRPGPESTVQYGSVSNSCQGSARSFAQSLMYAVDNGLTVGFGADMNGFTEQLKPRYSPLGCLSDYTQINNAGGPNELQKKGLAHVGLLPQLMSELQTVGTPSYYLDHMNRSAENFLRLWERSASLGTQNQAGTWTAWLNRDAPGGSGDWETLSEFVTAGQACANPTAIECQTTSGVDWTQSGEAYTCGATAGGICRTVDQADGTCLDYRVRFFCPAGSPVNGSFSYSASNTNSAQQYTVNHNVFIGVGQTIQLGTCSVSGSSGSGDTYLRLYGPSGTQVASSDDSCGLLSALSHTTSQSGTYQIRAGCYSGNSCSGTVAYTIQ